MAVEVPKDFTPWMTFTEALEQYLDQREIIQSCHVSHGPKYDTAVEHAQNAAIHMEYFTS